MDKRIKQIKDQAKAIHQQLVELGKRTSFTAEQTQAIREAEDGLAFWRRTHLSLLRKAFGDENWQY